MSKIFIQSKDKVYAQYLKSLVQQIPAEPEIGVHYLTDAEICSKHNAKPGLLIVYQDSEQCSYEQLLQSSCWSQSIWVNKNGSLPQLPGHSFSTVFFARPLDSSSFVSCVYQWCKEHSQDCLHLKEPPAEPFLLGNSRVVRLLHKSIHRLSKTDLTVLICGPTGTGKGVIAQALHNNSSRRSKQFLDINCANMPASLLESELFGYKKGAFTGAWRDKPGRLELAHEGSIFLDEVAEMSTYMQAKLLQVLQEKEFYPVGGHSKVQVKARLVAATNADLQKAIRLGSFREDLYYRLAVVRLDLPRLKDRKEDLPVLVQHFLDKFSRLYNRKEVPSLSEKSWQLLMAYDWPGNVRELESSIKGLVALGNEEMLLEKLFQRLPMHIAVAKAEEDGLKNYSVPALDLDFALHESSLKEIADQAASRAESELISKVMQRTNGKKKLAAQVLNVSYKCLLKKLKLYGL